VTEHSGRRSQRFDPSLVEAMAGHLFDAWFNGDGLALDTRHWGIRTWGSTGESERVRWRRLASAALEVASRHQHLLSATPAAKG